VQFVTVDSTGLVTHWCPFCGGVSHPSTGSEMRPGYVICGPCIRSHVPFLKGLMARKSRVKGAPQRVLVSFYEAASKWL
jgi:hypothetical protein